MISSMSTTVAYATTGFRTPNTGKTAKTIAYTTGTTGLITPKSTGVYINSVMSLIWRGVFIEPKVSGMVLPKTGKTADLLVKLKAKEYGIILPKFSSFNTTKAYLAPVIIRQTGGITLPKVSSGKAPIILLVKGSGLNTPKSSNFANRFYAPVTDFTAVFNSIKLPIIGKSTQWVNFTMPAMGVILPPMSSYNRVNVMTNMNFTIYKTFASLRTPIIGQVYARFSAALKSTGFKTPKIGNTSPRNLNFGVSVTVPTQVQSQDIIQFWS